MWDYLYFIFIAMKSIWSHDLIDTFDFHFKREGGGGEAA